MKSEEYNHFSLHPCFSPESLTLYSFCLERVSYQMKTLKCHLFLIMQSSSPLNFFLSHTNNHHTKPGFQCFHTFMYFFWHFRSIFCDIHSSRIRVLYVYGSGIKCSSQRSHGIWCTTLCRNHIHKLYWKTSNGSSTYFGENVREDQGKVLTSVFWSPLRVIARGNNQKVHFQGQVQKFQTCTCNIFR